MARILIIDDDESYCSILSRTVVRMGHEARTAMTLADGLVKAESDEFDAIFLDVRMPDGNGLEFIPRFHESDSSPEVIIITGVGDPDGAELAIKSGAWDYVQKGSSIKDITLPLVRALQYRQEKIDAKTPTLLKRDRIIGKSQKINASLELMAKAANSKANVLINGETGTGKELFARAIHENSPRAGGNFVVVDCAALPDTLVESVLFGHEKGAYTGAGSSQHGLVAQADRGTLFLDEVGELPLTVQKTFLRVLQEHRFRPVGGKYELNSDFRLVAATNRDLEEMVEQGTFRSDLLFRLRAFVIDLPTLRECRGDIKDISFFHIAELCEYNGMGPKGFSPEFLDTLQNYSWPGNIRELVNTLDRSLAAAQSEPTLYPKHLPPYLRIHIARSSITPTHLEIKAPYICSGAAGYLPKLNDHLNEIKTKYLQELMEVAKGDVKEACRISGLSRSRLYVLLKDHEILRPD